MVHFKNKLILALLFFISYTLTAQESIIEKNNTYTNNHKYYFGWGWNRGWYTKSDIHFIGTNYDFTLDKVVAKDRQSPVSFDTYLNPKNITIPQFNFRMGYFINEQYDISFGVDHMKYVVTQNQMVKINGTIASTNTAYDKSYTNEDITIKPNFLKFEHTDGLNFVNLGLRKSQTLWQKKHLSIAYTYGLEGGVMIPRTDATLLNNARHDKWHLAGFGTAAVAGINLKLGKYFFVQTELKGGYINMPDIRTTHSNTDKAKHAFVYGQYNFWFGASMGI
jgi:hypothetical protein